MREKGGDGGERGRRDSGKKEREPLAFYRPVGTNVALAQWTTGWQ